MNEKTFDIGSSVLIRPEYRSNPALQGQYQGTIQQVNQIGTTVCYTVAMKGFCRTVTHGVLQSE